MRASRTLSERSPTSRRTFRSNQSDSPSSTARSIPIPSSATVMARTSSATSHTRPSIVWRSTKVERNSGTCHGAMRPAPGIFTHRSERSAPHHAFTRPTRSATASSPMLCATGVRERVCPSSYSAHQRTTTPSSSRRTVPTSTTMGLASASKLPSEELTTKRLRSDGSHAPRNCATSAAGMVSARPRGKPSRACTPSMRAARVPPSSSSNPALRSMRGVGRTCSPLRATTRRDMPFSSVVTSTSASHVAWDSVNGSSPSADANSSTPARTRRVSHVYACSPSAPSVTSVRACQDWPSWARRYPSRRSETCVGSRPSVTDVHCVAVRSSQDARFVLHALEDVLRKGVSVVSTLGSCASMTSASASPLRSRVAPSTWRRTRVHSGSDGRVSRSSSVAFSSVATVCGQSERSRQAHANDGRTAPAVTRTR